MGRLVATVLLVAAAGIVAVVAIGPGTDKRESAGTPPRESSRTAPVRTQVRAPIGVTVRMRALGFHAPVVHVRVGRAVRWINRDDVAHTVFQDVGARSGEAAVFDSPRLAPGSSFRFVPTTPGVIRYVCTLHPGIMHGVIVVTGGEA